MTTVIIYYTVRQLPKTTVITQIALVTGDCLTVW
jgi:hypothetical protein